MNRKVPVPNEQEKKERNLRAFWWLIVVAVLATAADQLTKVWASNNLADGAARELPGGLMSLQLYHNPGAAFSFAEGGTVVITVVSFVICAAIIWYWLSGRVKSITLAVILGFILGGAAGNLIDRLIQPPGFAQGHVIDFLAYGNWFVGNVADIWIVCGVVALLIYLIVSDNSEKKGHDNG